jgi:hypothetical protein
VNVFQPDDGVVAVAPPVPEDETDGSAVPAAGGGAGGDDPGGVDAGGAGSAVEPQDTNISARHSPPAAVAAGLLRPLLAPRMPAIPPCCYFPAGWSEVIIFRRSLYSAVSV